MRAAALLALAGCNQIFGLNDPVGLVDSNVPADAPFPTVRLTHLVAQTRVVAPNIKGEPDPMLQRPALADPAVKIGPLAGPLVDASYDMTTGQVTIPPELFDSPNAWRLQYRVDGVLHDVYWTTPRANGEPTLVVPIFGRLARTGPPANSGYDIQPGGLTPPPPTVGNYRASHVFTTGTFIDISTGTTPSDTRIDGTGNKHISGPLGTPDAAAGDAGVLANYRQLASCEHLVDGYAEFIVPPLASGTRAIPLGGNLTPAQPVWTTNQTITENAIVMTTNVGTAPSLAIRLGAALGDDRSENPANLDPTFYQVGFAASDQIPLLTPERPLSFVKNAALTLRRPPGPLMFLLAQCALTTVTTGGFVVPVGLDVFPRIAYGVATNRRATLGGAELLSSVVTASTPGVGTSTFLLDLGVPLAIAPITLSGTALDGATDAVAIAPAATFDLAFKLEPAIGGFSPTIDYLEVTVFQVNGSAIVPLHVYVTANVAREADGTLTTPIRIDGDQLITGGEYVLQIRAVRGAPNAAAGDFETVAFPQAMATVFTRTFAVQ